MKRALILVILLMPVAASAQTQQEQVFSWNVGVFSAGVNPNTGQPIIPVQNFLRSAATCGIPSAPQPPNVINPTIIDVDDPANPTTMMCQLAATQANGMLASVPLGTGYFAAADTIGDHGGHSGYGAISGPFGRAVVWTPPPATGTKVR